VETGEAFIRVMSGDERGKGWELNPKETYTLGRSRKCNLHFADQAISANHARLECRGETWFVTDLESTHGTRINRQRIQDSEPLFDRDLLWIGKTVLEFRQYEQLSPADLAEANFGLTLPPPTPAAH
jgi:pSer/pThr/pTyr-binding forkhead associated (FHA) protein